MKKMCETMTRDQATQKTVGVGPRVIVTPSAPPSEVSFGQPAAYAAVVAGQPPAGGQPGHQLLGVHGGQGQDQKKVRQNGARERSPSVKRKLKIMKKLNNLSRQ